jgi:hypothetical protein
MRRMLLAGLSRWEPDPLKALEQVSARHARRRRARSRAQARSARTLSTKSNVEAGRSPPSAGSAQPNRSWPTSSLAQPPQELSRRQMCVYLMLVSVPCLVSPSWRGQINAAMPDFRGARGERCVSPVTLRTKRVHAHRPSGSAVQLTLLQLRTSGHCSPALVLQPPL